jgi:hypothetical protein
VLKLTVLVELATTVGQFPPYTQKTQNPNGLNDWRISKSASLGTTSFLRWHPILRKQSKNRRTITKKWRRFRALIT